MVRSGSCGPESCSAMLIKLQQDPRLQTGIARLR